MGIGKLFGSKIVDAFKIIKETEGKSDYDRQQKFLQAGWTTNQMISKPTSSTKSTPMAVDVSADGMRKKSKALKGTTVSYSGVRTSSQGLLTGAKTEKKTLLGG